LDLLHGKKSQQVELGGVCTLKSFTPAVEV